MMMNRLRGIDNAPELPIIGLILDHCESSHGGTGSNPNRLTSRPRQDSAGRLVRQQPAP